MPELPDVEIYKDYFRQTSLNKKISSIEVLDKRILISTTPQQLGRNITGRSFKKTKRHGKYLFAGTKEGKWIVMHFGMTGKLKYHKSKDTLPKYTKMVISFNGFETLFINARRLGKIFFTEDIDSFIDSKKLGPDALSMDKKGFINSLNKRKKSIKSLLMDQSIISGIGNIYADEILYQSGIHPKSHLYDAPEKVKNRLFDKIGYVLDEAVKRGAVPDKLPRSWILPVREKGKSCPKCKGNVKKIKINGRPTYFCPRCQKKFD